MSVALEPWAPEGFWNNTVALDEPSLVALCMPCFNDIYFMSPCSYSHFTLPLYRPFIVLPSQLRASREHTSQVTT